MRTGTTGPSPRARIVKDPEVRREELLDIAFDPSGSLLATASADQTVRLWDPASGQCVMILEGHSDDVNCVDFSPNGKVLASGSQDRGIRLELPWPAAPPTHEKLTLLVRYTTRDGRKLQVETYTELLPVTVGIADYAAFRHSAAQPMRLCSGKSGSNCHENPPLDCGGGGTGCERDWDRANSGCTDCGIATRTRAEPFREKSSADDDRCAGLR